MMPHAPNDRADWGERAATAYAEAVAAINRGDCLVRRVSEAERAAYENNDSTLLDLFPPGPEPIKVFSIDQRFRFGTAARNNRTDDYAWTMVIPITPRLQAFLETYFYPDNPGRGAVPAAYRGNPAFKVEHGSTTVVIRRQGWTDFWNEVDAVDFSPGFHSFDGATGF